MSCGCIDKLSDDSFVLKIDNFLNVLEQKDLDLYSSVFTFKDEYWCINFYKYKIESLSLVRFQPQPVTNPSLWGRSYSIRISDRNGGDYWRHCSHWGDSSELHEDDLVRDIEDIAPDGVLSVRLNFDSAPQRMRPPQPMSLQTLSEDFEKMLRSEIGCDLTLSVKGEKFRVHKMIIRARCPALHASDFLVPVCGPDHFKSFLLYLYTGKSNIVSFTNVDDLYFLGKRFELQELQDICIDFMINNLSIESFRDILSVALEHNISTVMDFVKVFFEKNLENIIHTQSWKDFSRQNPVLSDQMLSTAVENM